MNTEYEHLKDLVESRHEELQKSLEENHTSLMRLIRDAESNETVRTLNKIISRLDEIEKRLPLLEEE